MNKETPTPKMDREEIDRRVVAFFRDPSIVRCSEHILREPNCKSELPHPRTIIKTSK